jgi:hypothetical protein
MSSHAMPAILPVTHAQTLEYLSFFVNRGAYLRQAHFASKEYGHFYYYKACDRKTKQALSLDLPTILSHLSGRITIGLYAINSEAQSSKWIAIDADYADAHKDLLRLQEAFREDGIQALMEQSRRGGHLWIFLAKPLQAKLCRLYVLNIAHRLGVAIKRNKKEGIEVFPRQDELQPGEFGNAIRGPLGIHRASMKRYWFEDAAPTLDAQLALLRRVQRVTLEQLETLTAGMRPIPDEVPKRPEFQLPTGSQNQGFQILNELHGQFRRSGKNYVAQCPSCEKLGEDKGKKHLAISVETPTMYHCWAGCTPEMIKAAVGYVSPSRTRFASRAA